MTAPPSAPPGRVLVVDDNEMNRDMLSRRLRKRGYAVEVVADGPAALDAVAGGAVDVVLLDIMMPGMSGYEVLERLKADDGTRHIPVVMVSALDEMDSVVRCIKLGAADYLPKPFNATLLRARVDASLAVKRLHDEERAYTESLARELEIGREIQRGFLPEHLPEAPGWDLAARFRPAREVAGDFYDAFWMPGDGGAGGDRAGAGRLGLVVADVCDKGVGAALFMALFRSLIRSTALSTPPGDDAAAVRGTVRTVSDYIATTHGAANMFATVFFGVLDVGSGRLVYANGGHEAPAVVAGGRVRARLGPTGPALGLLPGLDVGAAEATLAPGEALVVFTDGATDAQDADGAFFTEDRLLAIVAEPAPSADDVLARLDAALAAHAGGAAAFDDVTLLAVARHAPD
ncbi:PP2C family protein-serine/threonine phosphatase [Rubrivirga sp.]|uniref:PP2C family protein-serine/threonine phosphatase n=1 Tax=Rubrivirga sp. TaxID=1885344 RepID=UPI003B5250DB